MLTTGLVLFRKPIEEVLAASRMALFDVKVFYDQIEGGIFQWVGCSITIVLIQHLKSLSEMNVVNCIIIA